MPNTISTTLDNSPKPNTMNKIGNTAIGGIIDNTPINGARVAPTNGNTPIASPKASPLAVAMPRPMPSRCKLAAVSSHST